MTPAALREIDTGDTVKHGPSGERWIVAFVRDDRLAWVGWPEGYANLADCTLVRKATDEERDNLLRQMADARSDDSRCRYARHRLGLEAR